MKEFLLNLWVGVTTTVLDSIRKIAGEIKTGKIQNHWLVYWLCYAVSFIFMFFWFLNDPVGLVPVVMMSILLSFFSAGLLLGILALMFIGWTFIKIWHDIGLEERRKAK